MRPCASGIGECYGQSMGVVYMLADSAGREAFLLNKGGWFLCDWSPQRRCDFIAKNARILDWEPEDGPYLIRVLTRLWSFANNRQWDVQLISDLTERWDFGITVVDSRFDEDREPLPMTLDEHYEWCDIYT